MLALVCYLLALIAFCAAAANVTARVNLIAVGLALWVLPWLVRALQAV